MAVTVQQSGTQLASIGNEVTVVGMTAANNYVFVVNATVLANGDVVEFRVKTQVASMIGEAYVGAYAHVQATPIVVSIPVPVAANQAIQATIKQTAGTARSFPWELKSL